MKRFRLPLALCVILASAVGSIPLSEVEDLVESFMGSLQEGIFVNNNNDKQLTSLQRIFF